MTPAEEITVVIRVIRLFLHRELTATDICAIRTYYHQVRPPKKEGG